MMMRVSINCIEITKDSRSSESDREKNTKEKVSKKLAYQTISEKVIDSN